MAIVPLESLPTYSAVYLSPHLDDAVLSCIGSLRADRRLGQRVLVATLFSEGDATYEARRSEDAAALALLGIDGVWAGFLDAPFRSARYRSFAGIVLDRDPADAAVEEHVERWIADLLTRAAPERVLAPLGVGGHVDHVLVHRAATHMKTPRLRFYEDRPYALVSGMVERRLSALGAEAPEAGLRDRLRFATDVARAGYLRSYVRPLDALRAPRLRDRRRADEAASPARWKAELVVEDPETQALASQALACYRSQWPELFTSLAQFERQTRRYAKRLGPSSGYVERLWHPAEQVEAR